MDVQLTADQKALHSGRLRSEEEAVREALTNWEECERRRIEFLATLDGAKASLANVEGRVITEKLMRELAAEVKERGRARLLEQLTNGR